jgi:hypothetical protein
VLLRTWENSKFKSPGRPFSEDRLLGGRTPLVRRLSESWAEIASGISVTFKTLSFATETRLYLPSRIRHWQSMICGIREERDLLVVNVELNER